MFKKYSFKVEYIFDVSLRKGNVFLFFAPVYLGVNLNLVCIGCSLCNKLVLKSFIFVVS